MPAPLLLLLVDDSEIDRASYRRFLHQDERYAYEIIECATGAAALAWCQTHTPDLLLLDYRLPDLDGLDFLRALQQQTGTAILPVALLTAYGNIAVVVEAMQLGAQNYLDKSYITAESLQQCVHSVLEQTQLKQDLAWQQEQHRIIATTSLRIRQSLNLEEILATATHEIRALLRTDRVLIYQFQPDWSGEVVVESVGVGWPAALGAVIDDPCIRNHWLIPYQEGRISHIDNLRTSDVDLCHREMLTRFGVQANLVVQLNQGDRLWGLLIAHHCADPRTWQPRDIELLQHLATQLAIAIEQAELHQQLQQELRRREQTEIRFQAIFAQSPEGKVRFAPDGSAIAANRAWEEIWQTSATVLNGYNLLQDPVVASDGHRPGVLQAFAGEIVSWPAFFHDPAQYNRPGRARWVNMLLYPIKDAAGQVLEVVMVVRDVTEHVRVQQQHHQLIHLVENNPNLVGMATLDGHVTFVNPAGQELVGVTAAQVAQSLIWDYHTPLTCEWLRTEILPTVLATGQWQGELELRHFQTGETIPLWCHLFTLSSAQTGEINAIATVMQDLRPQKQAEQALRQHAEQLNLLLRYTPAGIAMFDREMRYLTASQEWVDAYDLESVEALIGRSHYEVFPDLPERWRQVHQRCLAGASELCNDDVFVRASGKTQWVSWEVRPWYTLSGEIGGIIIFTVDVSQRKQAELALRQSEEQFCQLADNIDDVFWMSNAETGEILYINVAYETLWGRSCASLRTNPISFLEGIHPDDRPRILANLQANSHQPFEIQYRVVRPDGTLSWVMDKSFPIHNAAGEIYRRCGIVRDITRLKQVETLLREANESLEARVASQTAELQASATALLRLYNIITTPALNSEQRLSQLLEFGQHQFNLDYAFLARVVGNEYQIIHVKTPDSSVLAGDVFDVRQAYCLETLNSPEPISIDHASQSDWCQHPGYAGFGMESYIGMRVQVADAVYGVLCFCDRQPAPRPFQPIDHLILKLICQWVGSEIEQRQSTIALQQSEAKFRSAFDDAAIGMILIAPSGQFLQVNQALCDMLGCAAAELLTHGCIPLTHPDDIEPYLVQVDQLLHHHQQTFRMEKRYIHKQGHLVWALLTVSVVRDHEGHPLYLVAQAQDITSLKQTEQQLHQVNRQLRESNQELESFALIASHDLQEPLRSIRNFSSLLQMTGEETLNERSQDYLSRINNATERMQTLIQDLLQLSRVASLSAPFVPVDLNQVMMEVSTNLQEQLERTGGRLQVGPLPTIQADPGQLLQLLQNLVSNALKFHGEAPPLVKIYIQDDPVSPSGPNREGTPALRICVEDNGIGFEPEYRDRIFGIFERLHGRTEYEGTGIGLAICKKIAERHGGTLEAHSMLGQGATFILTLPQSLVA